MVCSVKFSGHFRGNLKKGTLEPPTHELQFTIRCLFRGQCFLATQLAIWIFSLCGQAAAAQNRTESELKAAYLFNFAKFTHWSEEASTDSKETITLCVVSEPLTATALKEVETRKIRDSAIRVMSLPSVDTRDQCSLIYLGPTSNAPIGVFDTLLSEGLLVVADSPRRGIISFVKNQGRLSFSVNLTHAGTAGVRLSSDLLNLASSVEGNASK